MKILLSLCAAIFFSSAIAAAPVPTSAAEPATAQSARVNSNTAYDRWEQANRERDATAKKADDAYGNLQKARKEQETAQREFDRAQKDFEAAQRVREKFARGKNDEATRDATQQEGEAQREFDRAKDNLNKRDADLEKAKEAWSRADKNLAEKEQTERERRKELEQTDGGKTAGGPPEAGPLNVTEQISQSVNEARSALSAMAAALKKPCDQAAFEAARQRVQSSIVNLAHAADLTFAGPQNVSLAGVGAGAHAALNEIAGRWKMLEQLWAINCGQGAVCAAPQSSPLARGGQGGPVSGSPSGSPQKPGKPDPLHNPPPIDPKPKADPDGQGSPGGGGGSGGGPPPQGAGGAQAGGGSARQQPSCPETPELAYYSGWLSENAEQIREREEVLEDPAAGPATKETAARQLEDLYKWRKYLEGQVQEESLNACLRQQALAQDIADQEARFQAQLAVPSPGELFDRGLKQQQLLTLQNVINTIQTIVQQRDDFGRSMRNRIDDYQRQTLELEREIEGLQKDAAEGRIDKATAAAEIKKRQDRIDELNRVRNGLVQQLLNREQAYNAELAQLLPQYQKQLWIAVPETFYVSEIQRIGEYKNKRDELTRTEEMLQVSDAAFQQKFEELERQIAEAEAAGDSARAEQLRRELENMRGAKEEWDRYHRDRMARLKLELQAIESRNAFDGVGPRNEQQFQTQWTQYGIQGDPSSRSVLTEEDKKYITGKVHQYADGARKREPDPNLVAEFFKELARGIPYLFDPRTQFAFATGVVEGTAEGIAGFVGLVAGGADLVFESGALALGLNVNTDALETFNAVLSYDVTEESFRKAILAAGQAVDQQLAQIGTSSNPYAAAAHVGGDFAGNVIVSDKILGLGFRGVGMVAGVLADAAKADDAVKLAGIGGKVADDAADAAKIGSTGTNVGDEGANALRGTSKTDGAADAGRGTTGAKPEGAAPASPRPDQVSFPAQKEPFAQNATYEFTDNGKQVSVTKGKGLGAGSSSQVFVDGSDPSRVVRLTSKTGDVEEAAKLDEFGRNAVESIEQKSGGQAPIRIVKNHETYTPDGGDVARIEINERVPQGTISNLLKQQGGTMTPGQAESLPLAARALNDQGFAWLDVHGGNWTLEPLPGDDKWRVVIIDAGGIVPVKGSTLAERAANARALQAAVFDPAGNFPDFKPTLVRFLWHPFIRDEILEKFGAVIDLDALGLAGMDQLAFNPTFFIDHPQVGTLFARGGDAVAGAAGGVRAGDALAGSGAGAAGSTDSLAARAQTQTSAAPGGGSGVMGTAAAGRRVPFTGAGLAGAAFNLLTGGGQGPFAVMTNPNLMCWSRLYAPVLTPWGLWYIPFDTYDPAFFQGAAEKNENVRFVEQDLDKEAQLVSMWETER